MFFPNRILYREELLSTTVTYAVDLSETEFLNLKPIVPIEQLDIRPAEFRLNEVADKILQRYAMHELHYLASVNADIQRVQNLVENWDYREVGHITIGSFRPGPDGGYAITDGNHRSVWSNHFTDNRLDDIESLQFFFGCFYTGLNFLLN